MILEDIIGLEESSGYSLEGSFTPDLVFSKYWLMQELNKVKPNISTMYVLGAWYGNLSLFLHLYKKPQVDQIVNIETNSKFLNTSKHILDQFGANNVDYVLKDANKFDYQNIDKNSAVVNTSLTDMLGRAWFDNIPSGVTVVLQARDHDPGEKFSGPNDIVKKFPLTKILYSGGLDLQDPETEYTRFMVIGIK